MSFTDQQRRIASQKDCETRWGGEGPGVRFRCYLCGHKFQPGDGWRWVSGASLSSFEQNGRMYGCRNFLVCDQCDGPDVQERWRQRNMEFMSDRFWSLR